MLEESGEEHPVANSPAEGEYGLNRRVVRGPLAVEPGHIYGSAPHGDRGRYEDPVDAFAVKTRIVIVRKRAPSFGDMTFCRVPGVDDCARCHQFRVGEGVNIGVEVPGDDGRQGGGRDEEEYLVGGGDPRPPREVVKMCIDHTEFDSRLAVAERGVDGCSRRSMSPRG